MESDTPRTATVNLRAIRDQLGSQIAVMERAVADGADAVRTAKKEGKKARIKANGKGLARARRILRKLRRYEKSLADECCDQQIQNCEFNFQ